MLKIEIEEVSNCFKQKTKLILKIDKLIKESYLTEKVVRSNRVKLQQIIYTLCPIKKHTKKLFKKSSIKLSQL